MQPNQQPHPPQQPMQPMQPVGPLGPPPKKNRTGKVIGFGCLGVIAAVVVLGGIGAALSDGTDDGGGSSADRAAAGAPKNDGSGGQDGSGGGGAEQQPADAPVQLAAEATEFVPTVLHDGGDYTSVLVTVTNNSDENVDVNPLSFAITDTGGTKHNADALGMDKNQLDTLTLAPGENAKGVVTAEGSFKAANVTFEENLFGDPVRASVR